jgi:hypothetical protein
MDMLSQLKLELMRARTELVFLLSEEVRSQASQVRNARVRINELLDAIAIDTGDVSSFIPGRARRASALDNE